MAASGVSDDGLEYYSAELAYLREMGAWFARKYPKIAARLELSADESPDPHVERLIESVAFLTGRIQRNLNREFPEVAAALLDVLYPGYLAPVPSATVVQIEPDPAQGDLTRGYEIPAGTELYAATADRDKARFSTVYPVWLWPLKVEECAFADPRRWEALDGQTDVASVVSLKLASLAEGGLDGLRPGKLRVYLSGDLSTAGALYDAIMMHGLGAAFVSDQGARVDLRREPGTISPVGFGRDEALLPRPAHADPGYALLQEYFVFPRKFFFLDVDLGSVTLSGPSLEILFLLGAPPREDLRVGADSMALGCTPAVNLFRNTTEPIRLDHRRSRYRLVPDARREVITEVHTIRKVSAFEEGANEAQVLKPYFGFDHTLEGDPHASYWLAQRRPTGREDVPGTEMHVSFVDLDFNPLLPATETVYAHTLCTNRRLAGEMPAGTELKLEVPAPVLRIAGVHRPTPQLDPALEGQTQWRLMAHLTLNHLPLRGGDEGLRAVREALLLYAPFEQESVHRQVMGIRGLATRPVVRRIGRQAWRGFCHGTEAQVDLDPVAYEGSSMFLFASVLRHFLALSATVNSFVQLVARDARRHQEWKRWPPLAGTRELL